MSTVRAFLAAPLLALLVAACGSSGEEPGPGGTTSEPRGEYVVTGVTDDGVAREVVPGSEIRFTFDDGHLGIRAGCNSMGGDYTLDGDRLRVRGLGSTDMGCPKPLMDQDAWVAGLFDDPVTLRLGEDAAITAGDVVLALAPREQVHPDRTLEGTRWELDGYFDADVASSVPGPVDGVAGRLEAKDGDVRLLDRCGEVVAVGTVAGSTITWQPPTSVPRRCVGFAELAASVGETSTYAITEDTLTLTSGDHGATFRAR